MIGLIFFGYVAVSTTIMLTIFGSVVNENKKMNKKKDLDEEDIQKLSSTKAKKRRKNDIRYNVEYILNQRNKNAQKTQYYNINYNPKRYIKNNNELKFYNALLEIANEMDLIIFSKAILKNIFKGQMSAFNKMSSKDSIFVLVRITDCQVALCMDLNYSKGIDIKKGKRDEFIDLLFYEYDLNLYKYPISREYDKESLKSAIITNMKKR